ncbi:MAG: DUF167 domain-containing protein [Rhodobacteraceae bacterium]|nr:DUF167 domain-containing protein [Paracoccaceae bacterium]
MSASFFRADAQGLTLALRVTPKSSRNAITGVMDLPDGQALKVAVTAAPDKGEANAAVCALLAKTFSVAKGAVNVITGATDRHKKVHVGGDPATLARTATALPSNKALPSNFK